MGGARVCGLCGIVAVGRSLEDVCFDDLESRTATAPTKVDEAVTTVR